MKKMKRNPVQKISLSILFLTIAYCSTFASKIICKPNITLDCQWDAHLTKVNFSSTWMKASGNMASELLPTIVGPYSMHDLEFRDVGSLSSCNVGSFWRYFRIKTETNVQCSMHITFGTNAGNPVLEWPIDLHVWHSPTLTEWDVLENTVRARRIDSGIGCGSTGTNLINDSLTNLPITTNGFTPNSGPLEVGLRNKPRFNNRYKNAGCNVYGRKVVISQFTASDACKKWLVSFQNINWCTNTHVACRETVYKYHSNETPVITVCDAPKVKFLNDNCLGETELKPKATTPSGSNSDLRWRVRIYLNNPGFGLNSSASNEYSTVGGPSGSTSITGGSPVIYLTGSRALPPGTHGLKYIVTNACGTTKECDTTIVVWPKVPTPICVSIATAVMKNGKVELSARHFEYKSIGYCGAKYLMFTLDNERPVANKLKFSHYFKGNGQEATQEEYQNGQAQLWYPVITVRERPTMPNGMPDWRGPDTTLTGGHSTKVYGCKVGNGSSFPESDVKMTVWDDRWYSDFCAVKVSFVDNQNACAPPPPPPAPKIDSFVNLGGTIFSENGFILDKVKVSLASNQPEYPYIVDQDSSGGFLFKKLPITFDYKITAKSNTPFTENVSLKDLTILFDHLLGIQPITGICKLEAADINGDGKVEADDLMLLMDVLMAKVDPKTLDSWRFLDKKQVDVDTIWPVNKYIAQDSLMDNIMDNDLIAVKVGDLDNSSESTLTSRTSDLFSFSVDDQMLKKGEIAEINLKTSDFIQLKSMQMSLQLNNLELLKVMTKGAVTFVNEKNILNVLLTYADAMKIQSNDDVITFVVKANQSGKLSNNFSLSSDKQNLLLAQESGLETKQIKLNFNRVSDHLISKMYSTPNPWTGATQIHFSASNQGNAQLSIFDLNGRKVYHNNVSVTKGQNTIQISDKDLLPVSGILLYQLNIGEKTEYGRMIKAE